MWDLRALYLSFVENLRRRRKVTEFTFVPTLTVGPLIRWFIRLMSLFRPPRNFDIHFEAARDSRPWI